MARGSAGFAPFSTSTNLIHGLQQREPEAWRRLVRLYGPLVHHWACRCGLQDPDAADVMQEVLQNVNRCIDRFTRDDSRGTFRGWLWVLTRNQIRDHQADQHSQPRPVGGTDSHRELQELPESLPPDLSQETRLSQRALAQIQEEFSPSVWQAFWRTAVEGDAPRHVAEDLGISVWAVYKARGRVLRRLRDELGEPGGEDSSQNS